MLLKKFIKTGTLATVFLLTLSNTVLANPVAARAAATLTNRVMGMLEPKIEEMVESAPIPPVAKDEMRRQLSEAASRIVNQEIQGAMGGRLPNADALVNKVVGELGTIAPNIVQGILDGSLAGGSQTATSGAIGTSAVPREKPRLRIEPFQIGDDNDGETIVAILSIQDSLRLAYNIVDDDAEYVLVNEVRTIGNSNVLMMRILNVNDSSQLAGGNLSFREIEDIMDQIPQVAARLAAPMLAPPVAQTTAPTVVYVTAPPAQAPTVTYEQRERKPVDHFFAPKWMPPISKYTKSGWAFDLEYGQVRESGWWWSVDGGLGSKPSDDDRSIILGGTFNIGKTHEFAHNVHIAYGVSAGLWYGESCKEIYRRYWNEYLNDWVVSSYYDRIEVRGFGGPIVRLRWQFLEVTYRGLIGYRDDDGDLGLGYISQLMVGFHFSTNNRRNQ